MKKIVGLFLALCLIVSFGFVTISKEASAHELTDYNSVKVPSTSVVNSNVLQDTVANIDLTEGYKREVIFTDDNAKEVIVGVEPILYDDKGEG